MYFFGAGTFGLPILEALRKSSHVLEAVVTTPDKPQGRGRAVLPSPLKVWTQEKGVSVLPLTNVNATKSLECLKELEPDIFVVASFGTILSDAFLELPPQGCVNIHPSLLPKHRGASPIAQALMDGEKVVGTTTLRVSSELDAGDILLQERLELQGDENAQQVWDALAILSAGLTVRTLDQLAEKKLVPIPQESKHATYCSKLTKKDSIIDWSWDAEKIHNRVRGLYMWPGTMTRLGEKNIKILKTRWDASLKSENKSAGTVLEIKDPEGLRVAAGKGSLWIEELQLEGKKPMRYDDFLHGHPLNPGFVFG